MSRPLKKDPAMTLLNVSPSSLEFVAPSGAHIHAITNDPDRLIWKIYLGDGLAKKLKGVGMYRAPAPVTAERVLASLEAR